MAIILSIIALILSLIGLGCAIQDIRQNKSPECKECNDHGGYASCGGCSVCGKERFEER